MENNSFFSKLSPKQSFLLGIGSAAVLSFIIGFFVLLGIVVKGKDGSSSLGTRSKDAPSAAAPAALAPQPQADASGMAPVTEKDWVKGNRDAKISVVEYSDTECPFCKRHHPTMQQLVAEYDGKVNWVYRHFPLTQLHPKAPKEAEATECAGELGGNTAFWKYIDRLFEITPANNGLDPAELPKIAQYVGLDVKKFEACLNSGKYAQHVTDDENDAVAAGGRGTPYSVILGAQGQKVPIPGALPYASVKQLIDGVLQ